MQKFKFLSFLQRFNSSVKNSANSASISYSVIGSILFFILIGHFYDLKSGDKNIGKIIGIVIGTFCGFYILGKSIFKNK
ncbi:MAG: hypothetical protein CBD04_005545 [bacterium TMED144]|nr:MAG: hypothetical protein CBD04_005545 [bacterium TMED144]